MHTLLLVGSDLKEAAGELIDLTADEDPVRAAPSDGSFSSTDDALDDLPFAQRLSARPPAIEAGGSSAGFAAHGSAVRRDTEQWSGGASLEPRNGQCPAGLPRQDGRDEAIDQRRCQGPSQSGRGALLSAQQRAGGGSGHASANFTGFGRDSLWSSVKAGAAAVAGKRLGQAPTRDLFAQAEAARCAS